MWRDLILSKNHLDCDSGKTTVLVRGLGTMGMSLACAVSKVGNYDVFGESRNLAAMEFAYKKGFIKNEYSIVGCCDIEIICTSAQDLIDILRRGDTKGKVIVDICGTKMEIVSQVLKQNLQNRYVSIHPMVHIEPKGYQFYKKDAFQGATVFIIDECSNNYKVKQFVIELLENIGIKEVITCSALEHDTILKYRF